MEQAVRWGIHAAQSQEPVLHCYVLPYWKGQSYASWVTHPMVHTLDTIPRTQFKFKRANYWQTQDTYAANPKWEVKILLVANPAGLQKYYNNKVMREQYRIASQAIGGVSRTIQRPNPCKLGPVVTNPAPDRMLQTWDT